MEVDFKGLTNWLEEKFAFQRLDNALLTLSALVNTVFAIGNSIYGRDILTLILPLYFTAWIMPVWSGYFLGAVLRRNLIDRMRGWMYLLAGSMALLISVPALLWTLLPLGVEQSNPNILQETIFSMLFQNIVIIAISTSACKPITKRLFKTVAGDRAIFDVGFSSRTFVSTYIAMYWLFCSMRFLYVWNWLRGMLEPQVIQLDPLIQAGVICFFIGVLFEILATKMTERMGQQALRAYYTTKS